jgi:hypothetical protein
LKPLGSRIEEKRYVDAPLFISGGEVARARPVKEVSVEEHQPIATIWNNSRPPRGSCKNRGDLKEIDVRLPESPGMRPLDRPYFKAVSVLVETGGVVGYPEISAHSADVGVIIRPSASPDMLVGQSCARAFKDQPKSLRPSKRWLHASPEPLH